MAALVSPAPSGTPRLVSSPLGLRPAPQPKFKTMMGEIPVKRQAENDLESVLLKLQLKDRSRRILLRSGLDLPSFLALSSDDIQMLGISAEEAGWLEARIVDMHKEPWSLESLGTMVPTYPSTSSTPDAAKTALVSAGPERARFSALDLSAQVVNVELHLQCIHSQLLCAERLLKAYSPQQLALYGFQEKDNVGSLVRGLEAVADQCRSVAGQAKRVAVRLRREGRLDETGTRAGWAKTAGIGSGIAITAAVLFLVYRKVRQ